MLIRWLDVKWKLIQALSLFVRFGTLNVFSLYLLPFENTMWFGVNIPRRRMLFRLRRLEVL
jgi:hypothetical protein